MLIIALAYIFFGLVVLVPIMVRDWNSPDSEICKYTLSGQIDLCTLMLLFWPVVLCWAIQVDVSQG